MSCGSVWNSCFGRISSTLKLRSSCSRFGNTKNGFGLASLLLERLSTFNPVNAEPDVENSLGRAAILYEGLLKKGKGVYLQTDFQTNQEFPRQQREYEQEKNGRLQYDYKKELIL